MTRSASGRAGKLTGIQLDQDVTPQSWPMPQALARQALQRKIGLGNFILQRPQRPVSRRATCAIGVQTTRGELYADL